jgi:hypothetical protein
VHSQTFTLWLFLRFFDDPLHLRDQSRGSMAFFASMIRST